MELLAEFLREGRFARSRTTGDDDAVGGSLFFGRVEGWDSNRLKIVGVAVASQSLTIYIGADKFDFL